MAPSNRKWVFVGPKGRFAVLESGMTEGSTTNPVGELFASYRAGTLTFNPLPQPSELRLARTAGDLTAALMAQAGAFGCQLVAWPVGAPPTRNLVPDEPQREGVVF